MLRCLLLLLDRCLCPEAEDDESTLLLCAVVRWCARGDLDRTRVADAGLLLWLWLGARLLLAVCTMNGSSSVASSGFGCLCAGLRLLDLRSRGCECECECECASRECDRSCCANMRASSSLA